MPPRRGGGCEAAPRLRDDSGRSRAARAEPRAVSVRPRHTDASHTEPRPHRPLWPVGPPSQAWVPWAHSDHASNGASPRDLLSDSGWIQEEDAKWKIKRLKRQKRDASWVTPLYAEAEALEVLEQVEVVDFDRPHCIDGVGTVTFVPAGHILGAAIVDLEFSMDGTTRRLVFSGDLGVSTARLLGKPKPVAAPDYLIIESTDGDRAREDEGDRTERLHDVISRTIRRKGKLIIPSFAVGRTQEVLTRIDDLVEAG